MPRGGRSRPGPFTVGQAAVVQARVTEFAAERGLDRYEVEMALKRAVRHAEGNDLERNSG
ncbi:hypothetical protein ACE1SV_62560 [Streptomyces sennicomposti]